jgi:NYN domain
MLAYAIDNQAPSTILLISGDHDFAYALSILRLRRYRIVLITLSNAHPSFRVQESPCFDWVSDVLEPVDPTLSRQPSPRQGKTSLPTHDKFYSDFKLNSHNPSRHQESYDEKAASNVESMNQDASRPKEDYRTPLNHDARDDLLPPDLNDQSKRQSTVASVASSALRNGPETSARAIYSPVASSCPTYLNGDTETPLTMTSNSNSPKPTLTPSTSVGSTPKLATYRSVISSALRGSANLAQNNEARVPEPVSFESAMWYIPSTEPKLQGSSRLTQQHTYMARNQSPSSSDQTNGDDSDAAHLDIMPPQNVTSPPSASVPFSSLNNATVSPVAQSASNPFRPTSCPPVPDEFKILVQCLKTQRSQGRVRLLRSEIALKISCNGTTYRRAGVSKFNQYIAMASKAGIVELGGSGLVAWIGLREPWHNASLS